MLILNAVLRVLVVPRGEKLVMTKVFLWFLLGLSRALTRFVKNFKTRDEIYARVGPAALLALPIFWIVGVVFSFSGIFWALGTRPYLEALELSGSSLTTLGFLISDDGPSILFSVIEAVIGLGVVALVFAYLPTIYSIFRSREARVSSWANRAGSPPDMARFLFFSKEISLLGNMTSDWQSWEEWFEGIRESHLSYPTLNFFRSPFPYDSWITTAGNVLDTASFIESAIDIPPDINSQLCIKAGYEALQSIAKYFDIEYPENPASDDPIKYPKQDFIDLFEKLEVSGVKMKSDKEQAWKDFAGWRVNYDATITSLEELINIHKDEFHSTSKKKRETDKKKSRR